LPGVDDGAQTVEDALAIARFAVADGITSIAATPHVRDDYPTAAERMERGVAGLRDELARAGIPLEVLPGGEIALERLARIEPDELVRFTLAQTGRYLLIEFPYSGWPLALEGAIHALRRSGITPILAHPERNPDVQERPARLAAATSAGALVQVTASSVDGREGRAAKRAAKRLFGLRLVHLLASDAHGRGIRAGGLTAAVKAIGDPRLARYLTNEAPEAIVAGQPVPLPPARRRRLSFRAVEAGNA
jgi:protein-tyrosine phosphatase